jgi:carbonic anhydrase/acetyltransferase-like protein (isoleucine patch superfamily)
MISPGHPDIYRFMTERPRIGERVVLHETASVTGSVVLGDDVSVWPMTVIRGDVNRIEIGARSNIQDGCVLHVAHERPGQPEGLPLIVGEDVTVGHRVILHACTIGDRCLVGMGVIIMDGAVLGPDALVAAGAVVTPGTVVPSGTLWRGVPAVYGRDLDETEIEYQAYSASHYVRLKNRYLEALA